MYWTPAIMLQAEDRIHRMGQKNKICVNYHYLYGEGTLDSLLYEKLQTKLAIVSEILEGKSEYLQVEETKESVGDFNSVPSGSTDKRKKDAYGKSKRDSSPSSGERSRGMMQITSYFQKKPGQSSEKVVKTEVPPQTERQVKSEQQDSINWEEIEKLLEEDQDKEEKAKNKTIQQRKPIKPFNDDIEECNEEMMIITNKTGYEEAKNRGPKEQEDFENKMFNSCLQEILEQEKGPKGQDSNNIRDIRRYFGNDREMVEEKDDLLSLWKSPTDKHNSKGKHIQEDLFLTQPKKDYKTPIRTADSSGSKNNSGSQRKGGFRFSLQPTNSDFLNSLKEAANSKENSENNEKKRKRDVIDLEVDNDSKELGLSSHIIKRLKENMATINERTEE